VWVHPRETIPRGKPFWDKSVNLQSKARTVILTEPSSVTPRLEGRSFGTNVMEATLLALMEKSQSEVTDKDFIDLIERILLEPNIEVLNP
jgi:hypothetical protein